MAITMGGQAVSLSRWDLRHSIRRPGEPPDLNQTDAGDRDRASSTGRTPVIVDGTAATVDSDGHRMLALTPTRAVLHRRGQPSAPTATSCSSDCIPILG